MKKFFFFRVAALSFLISSFWAQQVLKAAEVYGQIRVRSRISGWTSNYPRVEVELRNRQGVPIQTSISDANGIYHMFNVSPGQYDVVVDGQTRVTIDVPPGSERQRVRVDNIIVEF